MMQIDPRVALRLSDLGERSPAVVLDALAWHCAQCWRMEGKTSEVPSDMNFAAWAMANARVFPSLADLRFLQGQWRAIFNRRPTPMQEAEFGEKLALELFRLMKESATVDDEQPGTGAEGSTPVL